MENEFDRIIRERLSEDSSAPADLWDKIESKLDAFENPIEAKKPIEISPIWKYAAAAVVSGIAVALGFMFVNNNHSNSELLGNKPSVLKQQDIQIGEELTPAVQLVSVGEVKQTDTKVMPLKNVVKHKVKHTLVDEQLVAVNDNAVYQSEEVSNIPVFALKLNSHKTTYGMNDKITVLSGEPMRVEVDAELNQKHIVIQQRLRLINEHHNMLKKLKEISY